MKDLFWGLALLAIASPAFSGEVATTSDGCYRIERVLDPAQPADVVEREMALLRAAAEAGKGFSAYLLGTLYRLGPAHPAARVAQDRKLAREFLHKGALAGNLLALAGLAELDLAEQRPREALVHALAYVHYARKYPEAAYFQDRGRAGSQVNRAFRALGEPRSEALDADILAAVNAFVAEHGDAIEAAIDRQTDFDAAYRCPSAYDKQRWPLEREGGSDVMGPKWTPRVDTESFALFHLSINPKGRVDQALLIDYWPDEEGVDALRKVVEGARFNKLRDAPTRVALLPAKLVH